MGVIVSDKSFMDRQVHSFKFFTDSMKQQRGSNQNFAQRARQSYREMSRSIEKEQQRVLRRDFAETNRTMMDYERLIHRYNLRSARDIDKLSERVKNIYSNEEELRDMEDNFKDALRNMKQDASSSGVLEGLQLFGLGNIQGQLNDDLDTSLEMSNKIKQATGLSKDEMTKLRKEVRSTTKDMNSLTGGMVNYKDVLTNAVYAAEDLSVTDPEAIRQLAKYGTLLDQSSEIGLSEAGEVLRKMELRGQDMGTFVDDFVNVIAGMEVEDATIMKAVETLQDMTFDLSDGDVQKMDKITESILKSATLMEDSYIDPAEYLETFKSAVWDQDPEAIQNLTSQLSQVGLSVQDAQRAFESGMFDEFTAEYMRSVSELFQSTDGKNRGTLADIYGVDREKIQYFIDYAGDASGTLEDLNKSLSEGEGAVGKIGEQYSSWIDRLQNSSSTFTMLGESLASFVEGIGLNPLETIGMLTAGKGALTGAKGIFSGLFGSAGTGAGAGLASGLATAGINLGAGNLAGGASLSAGALAGLGATGIAGGLLGLAGIGKGLSDIYKGFSSDDKKERKSRLWQGGAELGMVGTGAATGAALGSIVPVIGTTLGALIGAGVGGLGATLKGKSAGNWLSGAWDSTTEFFSELGTDITDWASETGKKLGETSSALWNWTENKFEEGISATGEFLSKAKDTLSEAGDVITGTIGSLWKSTVDTAKSIADIGAGLLDSAGDLLSEIGSNASSFARGSVDKVSRFFSSIDLPFLDEGTNYVKREGMAYLHEGEAIVPKKYNPAAGGSDLQSLRALQSSQSKSVAGVDPLTQSRVTSREEEIGSEEVVEAIQTLTSFMKFWYQDDLERTRRQDRKSSLTKTDLARNILGSWGV